MSLTLTAEVAIEPYPLGVDRPCASCYEGISAGSESACVSAWIGNEALFTALICAGCARKAREIAQKQEVRNAA